jgi:hypothetical protein
MLKTLEDMPCALTQGFPAYDCSAPSGGLTRVLLLPYTELVSVTQASYLISAITDTGSPSTWYAYNLQEETGLLESTENKNVQNNSLFYDVNLSFTLNKMESAKSAELHLLAIQRLCAIVETVEGNYFFLGDERGCHKTGTNTSSSGTAFGDANQYSINLLAKSSHDCFQVDSAVIAGLTIA